MAEYAEHKVDKKLVVGPVEEVCGDPGKRTGGDTEDGGVDGLPKESGGLPTVTFEKVDGK